MTELKDAFERQRALDISQSFLIQAPAGSGKTELLIQRYLKLLGESVSSPEEIIAITFTKKAAAEMRHRIASAIEFALNNDAPESPHQLKTWQLSKRVIEKDEEHGWNLLKNPNRLKLLTIDALCARFTRQLPILSQFGSQPSIHENIEELFESAGLAVLSSLDSDAPWSDALELLLRYLDNDSNKLLRMFVAMLHNRDQWLPYAIASHQIPRSYLENNLTEIVEQKLFAIDSLLNNDDRQALIKLLRFAANNLLASKAKNPICDYANVTELFPCNSDYLFQWQALIKFLLTDSNSLRSRLTVKEGFPAASAASNNIEKEQFKQAKFEMQQLLASLAAQPELLEALIELKNAPSPTYSDEQWLILEALVKLLPVLVAELHLLFKQTGTVDYIEIALRALQALGTPEEPTDLSLALDYQIKHILIDEFQDTSVNQFRLLELLTAGWEINDGRTLFLVGDPMQSIYRFRKAEVGLFIKARDHGINLIDLEFLKLSVNFRSVQQVVEWNNELYQKVFPAKDNLLTSAVHYSNSVAFTPESLNSIIELHPIHKEYEHIQADLITSLIQQSIENNPAIRIAILASARSHLADIINSLKAKSIPYYAVELESLFHKMVIQDLLSLTKALVDLTDTVAWLSILRAPWCGLELSDLLIIQEQVEKQSIFETLCNHSNLELSDKAHNILMRIMPVLQNAWFKLQELELSYVIEGTWQALGGFACISESDRINVKSFFKCLEKFSQSNQNTQIQKLEASLQSLMAESTCPETPYVELMTIHKSKGLEFDMVILPGLAKATRCDDNQLLAWQEIPTEENEAKLLLAPIKSTIKEPIYDYIRALEKVKLENEQDRLLYVATTRAKESLHLFFTVETKEENTTELKAPASGSLLARLWPAIKNNLPDVTVELANSQDKQQEHSLQLKRIVPNWQPSYLANNKLISLVNFNSALINRHHATWNFAYEQNLGLAFHSLVEQISKNNFNSWASLSSNFKQQFIQKIIISYNFPDSLQESALTSLTHGISNMLNDSKGRWILQAFGESEYEFNYTDSENLVKKSIIDRLVFDDKTIWIVDFKTSTKDESVSQTQFAALQKKQYKDQLYHYRTLIQTYYPEHEVQCALYYPMLPAWIEVE